MNVDGKRVLVVGLARSGLAVAHALARRGALVTVSDRKPPSEFADVLPDLVKAKIGMELGSQPEETFLRHDVIVTSPGVPWDLPQLQAARGRNIPIYPEVEAASWFLDGTVVGITGSNGKTTTTSLLGDMLKASGFPTFVGGNIGNALSCAVDHAAPGTKFVTELSSFQLEGIRDFRPRIAVLLNLSPNHLDRHPNLEAYGEAKRRIFHNQRPEDYAVLNADDEWVSGLQATVRSQPVLFSRRRELPFGVFAAGGKIYYRVRHLERVLFETSDVSLRGDFNLEDVLAATTAACLLGADFAAIRQAVRNFKAVEHRLEFVQQIQGVDFFNNSKATSVDATVKSLEAFSSGVHLILGGKDKGAPYTPIIPLLKNRVREVLVIGAAAPVITQQLAGTADVVQAGDLATAVSYGFARAQPGDTVLLAPACSSFDQFKDYEERGRVFKGLVHQLADQVAAGRLGTRDTTGHGIRDTGYGTRDAEKAGILENAPASDSEHRELTTQVPEPVMPIDNSEVESSKPVAARVEGKASSPASRAATADRQAPESESRIPFPVTRVPSDPVSRVPSGGPHHLELTYVYELDAEELPEAETQVVPEDEPAISLSEGATEFPGDDALPYELREEKAKAGAGSRTAGAREPERMMPRPESDAEPSSRQQRLPGVE